LEHPTSRVSVPSGIFSIPQHRSQQQHRSHFVVIDAAHWRARNFLQTIRTNPQLTATVLPALINRNSSLTVRKTSHGLPLPNEATQALQELAAFARRALEEENRLATLSVEQLSHAKH
jgi:hypothetical protein